MIAIERTSVPSAVGALHGLLHVPDIEGPLPGLVLVDGSGDGAADDWGGWPERLAACGAVVLTHDKPGCGGSPGDWLSQTLTDRAHESLAALDVVRAHPRVSGRGSGLFGVSQGGWVSLLAAAHQPESVDFVVSMSGPGVSPAAQDRVRIERALQAAAIAPEHIEEALVWLDERTALFAAGEQAGAVLARQQEHAERPWYPVVTRHFDSEPMLAFLAGLLAFEPAEVLPGVQCPVLALFGADDSLVPVPESVRAFATFLPERPDHGIAAFPGANHGLFVADPIDGVDRTSQLAPGFLDMVAAFLGSR